MVTLMTTRVERGEWDSNPQAILGESIAFVDMFHEVQNNRTWVRLELVTELT